MFSNLKKKIEAEVGDLSRLTPNLRSVTHSEKLTPLSSRHNSVSSLASETSYSNKVTSPLSPFDPIQSQSSPYGSGPSREGSSGISNSRSDNSQQKIKRMYEEKMQTQELDFAWRLSSKDEEIAKLQKQIEHVNSLLQSKEFETQQKLVRVQEDMDSLEGFSQQENAKIKHLLLNREEELSQLRATVMMKESMITEFESQVKNITVENDRLKRSLDEVVGRQGNFGQLQQKTEADEEEKKKSKLNEERIVALQSEKEGLERSIKSKDVFIEKLQTDLRGMKQEADSTADGLRKENSFVLKELKEITSKMNKINQESEQQSASIAKLQQELATTKALVDSKDAELSEALLSARKLQELNGELTLQVVSKTQENLNNDELGNLQTEFQGLKSNFSRLEEELLTKDELTKKLTKELETLKAEVDSRKIKSESEAAESIKLLEDKSNRCSELSEEVEKQKVRIQEVEKELERERSSAKSMEVQFEERLQKVLLEKTVQLEESVHDKEDRADGLQWENEQLKTELQKKELNFTSLESKLQDNEEKSKTLQSTVQSLSEEKTRLNEQLSNATQSINSLNLQLQENSEKVKELANANEKIRSELSNAAMSRSDFEMRIREKDDRINSLQSELIKNLEGRSSFENELATVTEALNTTKEKLKVTAEKVEVLQKENDKLKLELNASVAKHSDVVITLQQNETLLSNLQSEFNKLSEDSVKKEAILSSLKLELKKASEENIKKETILSNLQTEVNQLSEERLRKDTEVLKANQSLDSITCQLEEKEKEVVSIREKLSILEQQISDKNLAAEDQHSKSSGVIEKLEEELAEKQEAVTKLQTQVDEFQNVEIENSELVLQISEIQSKCDELEEENKFLKEATQTSSDYEALQQKLTEMEGEVLDKNQMLKQQSHQLQDLRRSLAKEINKNQIIADNANALETPTQCNGSGTISQSHSSASLTSAAASQPPTLPPQETDVNFMYLRSVMFKYLTTTDAQVTHQLTRVVATLLHLSEEETHLLSQSTETRNSWMSSIIPKS